MINSCYATFRKMELPYTRNSKTWTGCTRNNLEAHKTQMTCPWTGWPCFHIRHHPALPSDYAGVGELPTQQGWLAESVTVSFLCILLAGQQCPGPSGRRGREPSPGEGIRPDVSFATKCPVYIDLCHHSDAQSRGDRWQSSLSPAQPSSLARGRAWLPWLPWLGQTGTQSSFPWTSSFPVFTSLTELLLYS